MLCIEGMGHRSGGYFNLDVTGQFTDMRAAVNSFAAYSINAADLPIGRRTLLRNRGSQKFRWGFPYVLDDTTMPVGRCRTESLSVCGGGHANAPNLSRARSRGWWLWLVLPAWKHDCDAHRAPVEVEGARLNTAYFPMESSRRRTVTGKAQLHGMSAHGGVVNFVTELKLCLQ